MTTSAAGPVFWRGLVLAAVQASAEMGEWAGKIELRDSEGRSVEIVAHVCRSNRSHKWVATVRFSLRESSATLSTTLTGEEYDKKLALDAAVSEKQNTKLCDLSAMVLEMRRAGNLYEWAEGKQNAVDPADGG